MGAQSATPVTIANGFSGVSSSAVRSDGSVGMAARGRTTSGSLRSRYRIFWAQRGVVAAMTNAASSRATVKLVRIMDEARE